MKSPKLRELSVSGIEYLWAYRYDENDISVFPVIS